MFELGTIVVSRGIIELMESKGFNIFPLLGRHAKGDWGEIAAEDAAENDLALSRYLRIFSVYHTKEGHIWIITEADRSATTVLLPSEY